MPEGHVTHRLAHALTESFGDRPVRVSSPQGRFAEAAHLLDGSVLVGAESIGKHLLITFEGERIVWIHLGLIGKFGFGSSEDLPNPQTLRLRISNQTVAADLRGPQWCRLITGAEREAVIATSGPDPLRDDADPARAWAKVSRSRKPIGAVLMDQAAFAGVGNIFRAEVLFRHGIDPQAPANRIGRSVVDSVWRDLVAMMSSAVESGTIDSVDSQHSPEAMGRPPRVDRHGGEVYVYRRAGQPCWVCGGAVATDELEGRHLYWCPQCQPSGSTGQPR